MESGADVITTIWIALTVGASVYLAIRLAVYQIDKERQEEQERRNRNNKP